jgi:L-Ala-D/L-Glu epimerase
MPALKLDWTVERIRMAEPFAISGYVFEDGEVVVVTLDDGSHRGRGEGNGVYYFKDDASHISAELARTKDAIEAGPTREELRAILPPGGARNVVDAALWDLEAKRSGKPVWQLAGLTEAPKPVRTTLTVPAEEPEVMAARAVRFAQAKSIKIKLTGDLELDIARVAAIRAARPDVWLGVDGNQGFARADLEPLVAALIEQNVSLLEQPLPRGSEAELEGFKPAIPIAGDESIISLPDVARAVGRFDVINIKLDKCGGLTEALMMAAEARRLGLGVMVGTMFATSLGTAPGFVLAQICDLVDLDGPILLAEDRQPSVSYTNGDIWAGPEVWGSP